MLRDTQRSFFEYLMGSAESIPAGLHVRNTDAVDSKTRLNIYWEAYRLRLQEALSDSYPALHTLIGDDDFDALSLNYISSTPSHHFSIRYFGHLLSDFLRSSPTYKTKPLLIEMSDFEWALRHAFDASSDRVLKREDLQNLTATDWPKVRFNCVSSVEQVVLNWNVAQLWQAIDADSEPVAAVKSTGSVNWVIWRKELITCYKSVSADFAWIIFSIRNNDSFAVLCEGITEWVDAENAAARVAGILQEMIADGMLAVNVTVND